MSANNLPNSPISRIASTARLSQNSPHASSPMQGGPLTANTPYLINTTTNGNTPLVGPYYNNNVTPGLRYSKDVEIFNDIEQLETLVSDITKSIGSFKSPEFDTVKKFVDRVDSIEEKISQIKNSTRLQREQSLKLNQANIELSKLFKEIMIELRSYRKTLLELPLNSSVDVKHENHNVSTEMLLEYALKLSKFSKIPRMVDMNITAANFVWPGEDSLRRGVLAMVSNDPSKFVDFEVEQTKTLDGVEDVNDQMEVDNNESEEEFNDFKDVDIEVTKKEQVNAVEGLDLFDSDDDD